MDEALEELPKDHYLSQRNTRVDRQRYNLESGEKVQVGVVRNAWKEFPTIMEFLRAYDPRIKVVWNNYTARWQIWRESQGKDHFVYTVEGPYGSYRPLDMRLFRTLFTFDISRYKSPLAMAAAMEAEEEEREKKILEAWESDMNHAMRDNKRLLMKALGPIYNQENIPLGEKPKTKKRGKVNQKFLYDQSGRKLCSISTTPDTGMSGQKSAGS